MIILEASRSMSNAGKYLGQCLKIIGVGTRNCYRRGISIRMNRCFWTYSKFLLKMAAFSAKHELLTLSLAPSYLSVIMSAHHFSQLAK